MPQSNTKCACLALLSLSLLTLADSMIDSLLPNLSDNSHTQPGFWNWGTAATVLKCVSDLFGQLILGYLLCTKSVHYAMNINTASVFAASIFSLSSFFSGSMWTVLAALGGPLIRCLGGGSHASIFLTLTELHNQEPAQRRSAYYYAIGAVIAIAQSLGPSIASVLAGHSHCLAGALSTFCCFIAFGVVYFLKDKCGAPQVVGQDGPSPVREPLLPNTDQDNGGLENDGISLANCWNAYFGRTSPLEKCNLAFLPIIFFLMAISKSTRPLFTTYIQHRDHVSTTEAEHLWLLRCVITVAIFGIVLPLVILGKVPKMSSSNHTNLCLARFSILSMSGGAFMIGLSGSSSAITTALLINTFGVATDLSLLAFVSGDLQRPDVGAVMMLIASIESAGSLLGIGVLYPVYQWSMKEDLPFLAGGMPYYICGSLYAVTAGLIWHLK